MDNYINPFFVAGRIPPEFFCDRDTETKRLTVDGLHIKWGKCRSDLSEEGREDGAYLSLL